MTQEDIENYIKNIILNKKGYEDRTFLYAKKLKSFNPAIEIWLYFLEEENFDMGYFLLYKNNVLQNQKYEDFKGLIWSDSSFKHIFNYEDSTLEKQIEKFRCGRNTVFIYDFNHDGTDEILSFSNDTTINIGINSISIFGEFKWLLSVENPLSIERTIVEFIIYKGRRGIKICAFNYEIEKNQWTFYYYDRIQQKYVQDENAPSEELEQIHGSPDFFAEAGIDYMKLERPLLPADLEGFSKPALRIWRNAIYARHGRTFKSEDLQALFNEYAWYKPDEEYSDEKLSDIDRANIKLIQMIEKK